MLLQMTLSESKTSSLEMTLLLTQRKTLRQTLRPLSQQCPCAAFPQTLTNWTQYIYFISSFDTRDSIMFPEFVSFVHDPGIYFALLKGIHLYTSLPKEDSYKGYSYECHSKN